MQVLSSRDSFEDEPWAMDDAPIFWERKAKVAKSLTH